MWQRDIGLAYRRLPDRFTLEGGVEAVLFERIRPLKRSEIVSLATLFRQFYPERPHLFTYRPPYDMINDTQ